MSIILTLAKVCLSVLAISLVSVFSFAQAGTYSVEDVAPNTASTSDFSYFPKKINDSGVITGFKYYLNSGSIIAQTWTGTFELPAGGTNSNGFGISNGGIVVGPLQTSTIGRIYTTPEPRVCFGFLVHCIASLGDFARHTQLMKAV